MRAVEVVFAYVFNLKLSRKSKRVVLNRPNSHCRKNFAHPFCGLVAVLLFVYRGGPGIGKNALSRFFNQIFPGPEVFHDFRAFFIARYRRAMIAVSPLPVKSFAGL
jgi:hypothetical protein